LRVTFDEKKGEGERVKERVEDTANVVFVCSLIGLIIGIWFFIIPS
jgi:hypothetical protein